MMEVEWLDKYLGPPTLLRRSKKVSFANIKDRVWKKLQGWKEKLLYIESRKGGANQVGCSTHTKLCYELFQVAEYLFSKD